jgi:hypothetical protein
MAVEKELEDPDLGIFVKINKSVVELLYNHNGKYPSTGITTLIYRYINSYKELNPPHRKEKVRIFTHNYHLLVEEYYKSIINEHALSTVNLPESYVSLLDGVKPPENAGQHLLNSDN